MQPALENTSPGGTVVGAIQVGRYELLMELASGGMATVFVGRQRGAGGFERIVAIKRMHPHIGAVPELAASFMDEARIASLIHHPNVVSVHDVHEASGERLLVMDYIEGVSLGSLHKAAKRAQGRLPRPVALRIVMEALRGLHAAHEQRSLTGTPLNIVHRDATPQNILLGVDGSVKLTDFGIARAAERSSHTEAGHVKGKFRYMAPEQAMGKPLDRRVDIFAIGAVLWELLTCQQFLKGSTDAEIIHQLATEQFEPACEADPTIPKNLSDIIMRAVAPLPEDRWPTAETFAAALDAWARANAKSTTNNEIAAVVNELCGEQIAERRRTLLAVLGGQQAPVALPSSQVLPAADNRDLSSSSSGSSSIAALSHSGAPSSSSSEALQQPARSPARFALIAAAAVLPVLLGVGVLLSRSSASPAASPASSAPAAEERVTIALTSERSIVEVKAPGIGDIKFTPDGATFTLPKGNASTKVLIKLADGDSQEHPLVPNENSAIRLVKPSATATAAATATATAAAPPAQPPAAKTSESKPDKPASKTGDGKAPDKPADKKTDKPAGKTRPLNPNPY